MHGMWHAVVSQRYRGMGGIDPGVGGIDPGLRGIDPDLRGIDPDILA